MGLFVPVSSTQFFFTPLIKSLYHLKMFLLFSSSWSKSLPADNHRCFTLGSNVHLCSAALFPCFLRRVDLKVTLYLMGCQQDLGFKKQQPCVRAMCRQSMRERRMKLTLLRRSRGYSSPPVYHRYCRRGVDRLQGQQKTLRISAYSQVLKNKSYRLTV